MVSRKSFAPRVTTPEKNINKNLVSRCWSIRKVRNGIVIIVIGRGASGEMIVVIKLRLNRNRSLTGE